MKSLPIILSILAGAITTYMSASLYIHTKEDLWIGVGIVSIGFIVLITNQRQWKSLKG